MTRVWQFVLTCLLGLALPVQGFGYSMTGCGPAHHGPALSHAQEARHHEGSATGHESDHAQGSSSADSSQHKHSHEGKAKTDKCSACASCCSATALPSVPVVLTSPVLKDRFAPFALNGVAAFLSEGLERPPRSILA